MSIVVRAMNCGWQTAPMGLFLEGETGTLRVPTPVFLIDHPKGRVLFDSGLHSEVRTDPAGRLGTTIASIFQMEIAADDDVCARLSALDVDPASIRHLVLSHLHFDHCGGAHQIPNARLIVQRREWEAGHDDRAVTANHYDPRNYDLGHDVMLVDGEHDLFGDGSVVCLPTHGHTPGHQSLRVRAAGKDFVFAADCCYLRRTLDTLHLPAIVNDRDAMLRSLERLRALRDAGSRIVFGHDAEQWQELAHAPQAL